MNNRRVPNILRNDDFPSPCEVFNCELYDECKNELLACPAFAKYVFKNELINPVEHEGTPPNPSKLIYHNVFIRNYDNDVDSDLDVC